MMKKSSLTAVAALLAASAASAADVTVFGKIDLGLSYTHQETGTGVTTDSLTMDSGNFLASRFGFKGSEQLTDTTTVGFVLENGFNADTGNMKTAGRLFDRGSWLYVRDQDAGELAAGRIGILRSSAADYSFFLLGARISPFGSGWNGAGSPMYVMPFSGVLKDNTLSYVSPSMAGFKVHLQYAMGDTEENKSSADRYYGAAVTYDHEAFQLVALADSVNEKSYDTQSHTTSNPHDAWTFTLGGNLNFDWGKIYAWGQYFKNADMILGLPGMSNYSPFGKADQLKGWSTSTAASVHVAGGDLMAMASYLTAENDGVVAADADNELSRYVFSVGYRYPISKSLKLYAAGTYYKDVITAAGVKNPHVVQVMSGLCYSF